MNKQEQQQHPEFDPEALQQLFAMEPKGNDLTPAQMVRRALFPRWEIIRPATFDPITAEDRRIQELLAMSEEAHTDSSDEHPLH